MRKRIYIAGPITSGRQSLNFANAADMQQTLLDLGYCPFCPHLSMTLPFYHQVEYETWMEIDFATIEVCHAIIRLPGNSPGADREAEFAKGLGIPVVHSVEELETLFKDKK